MKLLHIDSSILGENSVSRQLSAATVDQLRKLDPALEVTYRDLAIAPPEHFTAADMGISDAVLEEFLAADVIVIGAPMYNFTIPSQLKAWIDRILISGKTFRYGPDGVEGLAGDKRVILTISRGGFYGQASPAAALEHLETYLRGVFGFIGIVPEVVVAEGVAIPDQRTNAIDTALGAVSLLKAA